MKKIWKVLAIAAAASLLPYKMSRDQETGETQVDALLWQYHRRTQWGGEVSHEVTVFPDRLPHKKRAAETEHFDEEHFIPDEGVLIASYPDPAPEMEISDEPGPF